MRREYFAKQRILRLPPFSAEVLFSQCYATTCRKLYHRDGILGSVSGLSTTNSPISLAETTGNVTISQQVNAGNSTVGITLQGADKLLTNTSAISGSAGVTLIADKMALAGSIFSSSATTILQPNTVSANMDLGSTTDAQSGTLELSAAELTTVAAGILQVGRTDSTGTLTQTAALSNTSVIAGMLRLVAGNIVSNSGTHPGANIGSRNFQ